MLASLYIENVAVIQKASICLTPGFNVFTGETGAGKTVLISAIDAVLGERASRDMVRTGEDRAVVSALFEDLPGPAMDKLRELGYSDDEGSLLITREITAAGKSACRIGGMPATTSMLREIAPLLIHIHGQRDSQRLLLSEKHIQLIDAFGELSSALEEYGAAYRKMCGLRAELESLRMDDAQKAQRIDMLSFQISEIESAGLCDEQEEEILLSRRAVIRNSEKIQRGLSAAYAALSGGEEFSGINSLMDDLTDGVETAAEFIDRLEPAASRLRDIGCEMAELVGDIRDCLDELDFNPQELDDIEYRLDTIYRLKRKYGADIAEILAFCEDARAQLETLTTSDRRIAQLESELKPAHAEAVRLAQALSEKRLSAAEEFIERVEGELSFLDMPSVRLSIEHTRKELSSNGADEISFLISANAGEPPKPLSRVASGGELARVMLAVKSVLADRDEIPTLIFDEVDSGVSGRAAQKIGRKLRQVSQDRQVIAVTHLAQVAAFADSHLLIRKEVEDGRTFTRVSELDQEQKVAELARIMSGDLVTEISLQSAEELWRTSQNL